MQVFRVTTRSLVLRGENPSAPQRSQIPLRPLSALSPLGAVSTLAPLAASPLQPPRLLSLLSALSPLRTLLALSPLIALSPLGTNPSAPQRSQILSAPEPPQCPQPPWRCEHACSLGRLTASAPSAPQPTQRSEPPQNPSCPQPPHRSEPPRHSRSDPLGLRAPLAPESRWPPQRPCPLGSLAPSVPSALLAPQLPQHYFGKHKAMLNNCSSTFKYYDGEILSKREHSKKCGRESAFQKALMTSCRRRRQLVDCGLASAESSI
ncbi:hypothetical protein Anapl_08653 [Anas platyrhynchos]|uniref:Uncharacterized protein n=1 Tax=Anas platyrhynchos TaxID=8839 RepID=R0KMU1_ANAPL|nr:hypothetical protein Anapl_08653 [Anas platyrhynchos]